MNTYTPPQDDRVHFQCRLRNTVSINSKGWLSVVLYPKSIILCEVSGCSPFPLRSEHGTADRGPFSYIQSNHRDDFHLFFYRLVMHVGSLHLSSCVSNDAERDWNRSSRHVCCSVGRLAISSHFALSTCWSFQYQGHTPQIFMTVKPWDLWMRKFQEDLMNDNTFM